MSRNKRTRNERIVHSPEDELVPLWVYERENFRFLIFWWGIRKGNTFLACSFLHIDMDRVAALRSPISMPPCLSHSLPEPEHLQKLFITRPSFKTRDKSLSNFWARENIHRLCGHEIQKLHNGLVTYSSSEEINAAMNLRPHKVDGRIVETKRAVSRDNSKRPGTLLNMKKIHVGDTKEDT